MVCIVILTDYVNFFPINFFDAFEDFAYKK